MSQPSDASRRQRALGAVYRVAEEHGLVFDDAVILRDLSNLVVHLRGSQVVARVATATAEIRQGDAWLAREVAVASHLAAAGAPVVRPSQRIAPGPHHCEGVVLSFWEYIEERDEPPDPRAAGRALRTCHEALADFEGPLPRWGAWRESLEILARLGAVEALELADLATLQRVAENLSQQIELFDELDVPMQAVHGDAGPGNALNTGRGVLWTDWEDTFLGPIAWDLACLVSSSHVLQRNQQWSERALEAYGVRAADPQLDVLIAARALLTTVWSVVIGQRHPEVQQSLEARLQWFRERSRL